jgi:hypothetical protein
MNETVKDLGFSGTVYGPAGVGKTKLLESIPPEQLLIIDIEGGARVVKSNPFYVMLPKPVNSETAQAFRNEIDDIYAKLRFGVDRTGKPFREWETVRYVAPDSISELETYFQQVQAVFADQYLVRLKEFGEASQITKKYIIQFRDLKDPANTWHHKPINTIFIAGESPVETQRTENSVVTKMSPMLTKKFALQLCHLMDFVAHMELSNGKHMLRFDPTPETLAKSRFESISGIIAQPEPPKPMDFYNLILKRIEGELAGSLAGAPQASRKAPGQK